MDETFILKFGISLIPIIGGAISGLLSHITTSAKMNRILEYINNISEIVSQIDEDKIDKAYFESDEFVDIFSKSLEVVLKERDCQKIQMYAKILIDSSMIEEIDVDIEELLYDSLSHLTLNEVIILKRIFNQQKDKKLNPSENELQWAWRMGWGYVFNDLKIDKAEIDFFLRRLQSVGLIKEITGAYLDYSGNVFLITELGRKIMKHLFYSIQKLE